MEENKNKIIEAYSGINSDILLLEIAENNKRNVENNYEIRIYHYRRNVIISSFEVEHHAKEFFKLVKNNL